MQLIIRDLIYRSPLNKFICLRSICIIFAENKLHLGITAQTCLAFLHSICIIFAENKLHLGITAQTSLAFLRSICIIFAENPTSCRN